MGREQKQQPVGGVEERAGLPKSKNCFVSPLPRKLPLSILFPGDPQLEWGSLSSRERRSGGTFLSAYPDVCIEKKNMHVNSNI